LLAAPLAALPSRAHLAALPSRAHAAETIRPAPSNQSIAHRHDREALMDTPMPGAVIVPSPPSQATPPPESPTRLLLLAVAWVVTGMSAGIVTVCVVVLVIVVQNRMVHGGPGAWQVGNAVYGLLALIVGYVLLLWVAWRRGRIVGQGDAMAGLGAGPIRRPGLLLALAAAQLATTVVWTVLLGHWLQLAHKTAVVDLVKDAGSIGPLMEAATVVCLAIFAPLWEELFFRGWLWTGLRRHWSPGPVMIATALPWMLAHLTDGLTRPLFLLPAAIFLSLARQHCGGVRASLLLHVMNNLLVMAVLILATQTDLL
jgi:membrane protease YdiL (CAAX protease family)